MKKILILVCISLLSVMANAQKVRFGVRGGMNISTESEHVYKLSDEDVYINDDISCRSGIHAGGLVNIHVCQNLEIEVDVEYSMLGYKDKVYTETEEIISEPNYRVTSHYLSFPALVKFYPAVDGIYIELGPQLGCLMSKKGKLEVKDNLNIIERGNETFDLAVCGGFGYRFENDIFVDLRYVPGVTKTNRHYSGGKNLALQISLGYLF